MAFWLGNMPLMLQPYDLLLPFLCKTSLNLSWVQLHILTIISISGYLIGLQRHILTTISISDYVTMFTVHGYKFDVTNLVFKYEPDGAILNGIIYILLNWVLVKESYVVYTSYNKNK